MKKEPPMQPAHRLCRIQPSLIRVVSAGAPADAIPLGLGEPGWDLPEPARRALADTSGPLGYGPNGGLPQLREALAQWHGTEADHVTITSGTQGCIYGVITAFLNPGEAILMPEYGFPAYEVVAWMAEGERHTFELGERCSLDADKFVAALDAHPDVRIAFINHPGNPTGGGATPEAIKAVADACAERDVLLVSDEVYRDLYFGERPTSLHDVTDTGLVIHSMSKGWAAPGLRIGWAVGAPEIVARIELVHAFAVTTAAVPSQHAALALLEHSDEVLAQGRREIRARWDALADAARAHLGVDPVTPAGSFYWWAPLPPHEGSGLDFCLRMRDEGRVTVVPGVAFGEAGENYARVSFGAPPEVVAEGIRRMAPFWA